MSTSSLPGSASGGNGAKIGSESTSRSTTRWDERLPRLRKLPDSQLVHAAALYTDTEMKTSPAYNALRRSDTQNSLNVRLDGPNRSRIVLTLADPIEGTGWSSAQVETIERLLPHLRQFVRVRHALVDAEALGSSLAMLLDNTRSGVIQLDRHGRIVAANDRARDILRKGDALADPSGVLLTASRDDDAELQRLLARALPPFGGQGASGSMIVGSSPLSPRLVLHVSPVRARQTDVLTRRVAALVLVVDPGSRALVDPHLVAATLGLTPAESQIAVLLADGRSIRDIAIATGRGENTIRWHLKRIFSKNNISRQVELVRLVLALADMPQGRR